MNKEVAGSRRLPGSGWKPWFNFGGPAELIVRPGEPEYMWRFKVWRWLGMEGKFHFFRGSDPDDLHDHPWWFLSFMLAGSYTETWRVPGTTLDKTRVYRAPCVRFCAARHKHRVAVPNGPCLTFVVSGRRFRRWGFYKWCVGGGGRRWEKFIHWKAYTGKEEC